LNSFNSVLIHNSGLWSVNTLLSIMYYNQPRTQAFSPQSLSLAVLTRGKAW